MQALVLNGADKRDNTSNLVQNVVVNSLEMSGWKTEIVDLQEKEIAYCLGNFKCWIKTPGICVINDFNRELVRMFVRSNLLVYVTPVTFGGYSSNLKKAIDRIIPVILPFFLKIKGEFHHKKRYPVYPNLIAIGIMSEHNDEKEKIFRKLVQRNAINMHALIHTTTFFYPDSDEETISKAISELLLEGGYQNE